MQEYYYIFQVGFQFQTMKNPSEKPDGFVSLVCG